MIVVKVGGSLYEMPGLAERLQAFLASLGDSPLLVPGGGATADAIRAFDRDQRLGGHASHWLALRACAVNGHMLAHLTGLPVVENPIAPAVLDPFAFAVQDEGRPGALPHSWDATSDSVAARVAEVTGSELVLLKSVTVPAGVAWDDAGAAGHVDPLFPSVVRRAGLRVRAVNLRER
jgi:aspartokinase-like uncharacterized kinase